MSDPEGRGQSHSGARCVDLAELERMLRVCEMDPLESYEYAAERFYGETGLMAPGKDVAGAMASGHPSQAERRARWETWQGVQKERWCDLLRQAIAELRELRDYTEELQREADFCSFCQGTGIGQHGDPDTSRCSACGGRGYHRPERDDEPPDREEPLDVPVGYDGTGRY